MHTHPACPHCTNGRALCLACEGEGTIEVSVDRFDALRGDHSTREHTEACERCDGEGRVHCRACDGSGVHPMVGALLASTRALYARRAVGAWLARYVGANDSARVSA